MWWRFAVTEEQDEIDHTQTTAASSKQTILAAMNENIMIMTIVHVFLNVFSLRNYQMDNHKLTYGYIVKL